MKLIFAPEAWEDYLYWQSADKKKLKRINQIIRDTLRDPFDGIGKPEPLKHVFKGYWSRRIDAEHRMVYKATDDALEIAQLRHHYS